MELKETINLMISADYKERFRAEYFQACIRREKLVAMLKKWHHGKLDFTPACSRYAYSLQAHVMSEYITILEARAAVEGIDLGQ